ncbi:MAG: hypothetical protein PHU61_03580 [Candidatus Absconditabacteria bacterium]|nr:hypothetical protein [Candidatus Absconditabacteria bacterium]MDD4714461.1 hypothetical protein [Candidatus Absconditabacteria bacterium]
MFLISFNTKGGIFNKVEIEVPKYKHKLEEIIRIGEKNNFKIVVSEEGSKVTKYVNYFDNKLKTYDVILQPRK